MAVTTKKGKEVWDVQLTDNAVAILTREGVTSDQFRHIRHAIQMRQGRGTDELATLALEKSPRLRAITEVMGKRKMDGKHFISEGDLNTVAQLEKRYAREDRERALAQAVPAKVPVKQETGARAEKREPTSQPKVASPKVASETSISGISGAIPVTALQPTAKQPRTSAIVSPEIAAVKAGTIPKTPKPALGTMATDRGGTVEKQEAAEARAAAARAKRAEEPGARLNNSTLQALRSAGIEAPVLNAYLGVLAVNGTPQFTEKDRTFKKGIKGDDWAEKVFGIVDGHLQITGQKNRRTVFGMDSEGREMLAAALREFDAGIGNANTKKNAKAAPMQFVVSTEEALAGLAGAVEASKFDIEWTRTTRTLKERTALSTYLATIPTADGGILRIVFRGPENRGDEFDAAVGKPKRPLNDVTAPNRLADMLRGERIPDTYIAKIEYIEPGRDRTALLFQNEERLFKDSEGVHVKPLDRQLKDTDPGAGTLSYAQNIAVAMGLEPMPGRKGRGPAMAGF